MDQSPGAASANDHKLGGLKPHHSLAVWRPAVRHQVLALRLGVLVLPRGHWGFCLRPPWLCSLCVSMFPPSYRDSSHWFGAPFSSMTSS